MFFFVLTAPIYLWLTPRKSVLKTKNILGVNVLDILSKVGFKYSGGQLTYRGKLVDGTNLVTHLASKLGIHHPAIAEYYQNYATPEKTKKLIDEFVAKTFGGSEIDISKIKFDKNLPYTYDQIKIFRDQNNSRVRRVIFPSGTIHKIDSAELDNQLASDLGEYAKEYMQEYCIRGKVGYYPGVKQLTMVKDDVVYLNTWKAPSWLSCDLPTYEVVKFRQFMEYIFPDIIDLKFGYAWIRDVVEKKAGCVLILAGTPGFGKNLFVERILRSLVGTSNYTSASRGEAKGGKFHGGLDECRIRFYDELQLNGPMRNDIKGFMNEIATIEKKGVDLDAPKAMHASFIIANNDPSKVQLEPDDRKFWAPRLPTIPLLEQFGGQVWIDEFLEELNSDQAIKSIYHMCVEGGFGVESRFPHKNEVFYSYCINSLPAVIRHIIKLLEMNPCVESRDVPKTRLEPYEIKGYLEEYAIKSGKPIADFEDVGKGRYKITRPGFNPNAETENL